MGNRTMWRFLCGSLVAVLLGLFLNAAAQPAGPRWVTAWATSQQDLGPAGVSNATVRMIARVTAAGESVRIRLDNTYGREPLELGAAAVGQPMRGARLAPGSNRPVHFSGSASVTIPPGGRVTSDPVPFPVRAGQDLAVSLHVPGAGVRPSRHRSALTTSYLSADGAGDVTADETGGSFAATTTSMWWLKAIDVRSRTSTGTIDFDAVMRRADDADLLEAAFDCDGIHPNVLGYYEMGRSIPLDLFAP